ncbi:MAG TPA: hypothetical protein VGF30_05915 [Bacteroidia bacterium]
MNNERKETFIEYLKQKKTKTELLILTLFYVCVYFLISSWYPFPDVYSDSWNYMLNAQRDTYAVYRPVGYSHVLQFIHGFSDSIRAIFTFQLLALYLSNAVLIFSLKYIFNINGIAGYILSAAVVLSPCAIYMSNMIMSDSIFASLTCLFLTCVVWVLYRPKLYWLYLPIPFILFLILNIRFSGLFYPVLLIPFFFVNNKKMFWVPSLFVLISVMFFNVYNKKQMKQMTGVNTVLGGFGGWQWANNALHIIPHVKVDANKIKKYEHQVLHQIVMQDTAFIAKTLARRPATAEFMWDKESPLKKYLYQYMNTTGTPYMSAWVKAGIEMEEYGKDLAKQHPGAYLKYYVWPSSKSFFAADLGVISQFDGLKPDPKDEWFFEYYSLDKNQDFGSTNDVFKSFFSKFLSGGNLFLWILTFISLGIIAVFFKKLDLNAAQKKIFIFLIAFSILYCGFTIIATSTEIRYIIPVTPIQYLLIILAVLNTGYVLKGSRQKKEKA